MIKSLGTLLSLKSIIDLGDNLINCIMKILTNKIDIDTMSDKEIITTVISMLKNNNWNFDINTCSYPDNMQIVKNAYYDSVKNLIISNALLLLLVNETGNLNPAIVVRECSIIMDVFPG